VAQLLSHVAEPSRRAHVEAAAMARVLSEGY
jgi:hypothetical protein